MKTKPTSQVVPRAAVLVLLSTLNPQLSSWAQGTAFSYQGRLNDGANPANGNYDLRFRVASDPFGNNYVSGALLTNGVSVSSGLFTVGLDFGPGIFTGSNLWLEISVRTNGAGGYATLNPLQPFTASPYAITAGSASNLLGVLPSLQLTGALPSGLLSGTYSGAVTFSHAGGSFSGTFSGDGGAISNVNAAALAGLGSSAFWQLGGNNVGAGQFLGSTNNQPLELVVNGGRALRLEPNTNGAPNVIAGSVSNFVTAGAVGATIGGGGATSYGGSPAVNSVTADFGTVSGGQQNTAGQWGVVGGGDFNVAGFVATVGGGGFNNASGFASTIGGGQPNTASGSGATVGGGESNSSSGTDATVAGGNNNLAAGNYAAVPGGFGNVAGGPYSFAAGRQAQANHDGSFVWADDSAFGNFFASTASNQFLIRAAGGVGIGTASPSRELEVQSPGDTEIGIKSTDPGGHLWTLQSSGTNTSANLDASFQIIDRTLVRSRFFIGTNGNVGIGTTAPGGPFELHTPTGSNATVRLTSGGSWPLVFDQSPASVFTISNGGQSRITLLSSGEVGIGKTNPAATLDVNGTIAAANFSGGGANLSGVALLSGGNTFSGNQAVTNGSVGVGTATPASSLEIVAASDGDGLRLTGSTSPVRSPFVSLNDGPTQRGMLGLAEAAAEFSTDAGLGDLVLRANVTKLLLQTGTGGSGLAIVNNNVGIGTPAPGAKLDVRGDVKLGTNGNLFASSGVENLRLLRGRFNATTGTASEGSGFSVVHNGTGNVTITFGTAFATPPSITATAFSTGVARIATIDSFTAGGVTVRTWNTNGAAADIDFMFIAIGPR